MMAVKESISQPRCDRVELLSHYQTNIAYFFFSKPLKITKAGNFSNHYISVKFPVGTFFSSFTYEALINVDYFLDNNTIMGTEGVMILRIGDAGGGITPKDYLEVAGRQNYRVTKPLLTNRWYHVALTYDQPTGKTGIYVMVRNGLVQIGVLTVLIRIRTWVFILVESMVLNGVNVHSMVK